MSVSKNITGGGAAAGTAGNPVGKVVTVSGSGSPDAEKGHASSPTTDGARYRVPTKALILYVYAEPGRPTGTVVKITGRKEDAHNIKWALHCLAADRDDVTDPVTFGDGLIGSVSSDALGPLRTRGIVVLSKGAMDLNAKVAHAGKPVATRLRDRLIKPPWSEPTQEGEGATAVWTAKGPVADPKPRAPKGIREYVAEVDDGTVTIRGQSFPDVAFATALLDKVTLDDGVMTGHRDDLKGVTGTVVFRTFGMGEYSLRSTSERLIAVFMKIGYAKFVARGRDGDSIVVYTAGFPQDFRIEVGDDGCFTMPGPRGLLLRSAVHPFWPDEAKLAGQLPALVGVKGSATVSILGGEMLITSGDLDLVDRLSQLYPGKSWSIGQDSKTSPWDARTPGFPAVVGEKQADKSPSDNPVRDVTFTAPASVDTAVVVVKGGTVHVFGLAEASQASLVLAAVATRLIGPDVAFTEADGGFRADGRSVIDPIPDGQFTVTLGLEDLIDLGGATEGDTPLVDAVTPNLAIELDDGLVVVDGQPKSVSGTLAPLPAPLKSKNDGKDGASKPELLMTILPDGETVEIDGASEDLVGPYATLVIVGDVVPSQRDSRYILSGKIDPQLTRTGAPNGTEVEGVFLVQTANHVTGFCADKDKGTTVVARYISGTPRAFFISKEWVITGRPKPSVSGPVALVDEVVELK